MSSNTDRSPLFTRDLCGLREVPDSISAVMETNTMEIRDAESIR